MTTTGLEMLKLFEGFAPRAYADAVGKATIGYGHLILPGETFSEPLDETAASNLLLKDVMRHEHEMLALVALPLQPWEADALTSFCFNLGVGAFRDSSLRRSVNAGLRFDAADQLTRWCFAGGRKLPGLVRRRNAEAARYLGGNLILVRSIYTSS